MQQAQLMRINMFNTWLDLSLGKDIPCEVFNNIHNQIKQYDKFQDSGKVTIHKIRAILKSFKCYSYNDNYFALTNIMNRINGVPTLNYAPEFEETLRNMFKEVCACSTRTNLSFPYILFKFCQLLGRDDFLQYFPMMKSSEKVHACDQIWKEICKELGWAYIPSV